MQQVVDYLRANAAHDPALLVQQLRTAGHDDASITQAWDLAFPRVAQWPQPQYHSGPGTQEFAVAMPTRRGGVPTWAIALMVVVGMAIAGAFAGGLLDVSGNLTAGGGDEVFDEDLAKDVAAETNVTEDQAKAILDSVGGAEIRGELPDGWTKLQDGAWGTRSTGTNILVAIVPAGGRSLDELVELNVASAAGTGFRYGEPTESELFGQEARTLPTTGSIQGVEFEGEQTFLVVGDDLVLVNTTIMDDGDRADAERVIEQLRLV